MVASSVGGLMLTVTEACQFSCDSSVPSRPRLSSRHSIRQVAPERGSTETTCTLTVSVSARLNGSLWENQSLSVRTPAPLRSIIAYASLINVRYISPTNGERIPELVGLDDVGHDAVLRSNPDDAGDGEKGDAEGGESSQAPGMGLRDVAAVSFVPLGSGRNVYSGMWAIGIEDGGVCRSFHRRRGSIS
jgi:hypothetical protein